MANEIVVRIEIEIVTVIIVIGIAARNVAIATEIEKKTKKEIEVTATEVTGIAKSNERILIAKIPPTRKRIEKALANVREKGTEIESDQAILVLDQLAADVSGKENEKESEKEKEIGIVTDAVREKETETARDDAEGTFPVRANEKSVAEIKIETSKKRILITQQAQLCQPVKLIIATVRTAAVRNP